MTTRRFGERSPEFVAALSAAADPRGVTLGLPERVEGDCEFAVVADDLGGGMQAWDVAFVWDGEMRFGRCVIDHVNAAHHEDDRSGRPFGPGLTR